MSCATAAVFGHVWPIYHRFRGGKGAATFVGTLLAIKATLVIPLLVVWAIVLLLSGYVGLATMAAAVSLPVWVGLTLMPGQDALLLYTVLIGCFIVFWHRSNIQRMRAGTEHRNHSLMILGRKGQADSDEKT
jgi:glycerol-3-phosphate acyltransferase PlsY